MEECECVMGEIVSFLCSEDLLDYASVFRRGSFLHKAICAGFQGVFLFPLVRRTEQKVVKRLFPGGYSVMFSPDAPVVRQTQDRIWQDCK